MSKVEPSLNILLPTYNNEFPAELLDLANALLAQTQSRAAALKPDEQIAMPYACAEIACKRLHAKLRLPTLQSRPPCPPRVYKKLCTYLEQVLPSRLPTKRPAADQDGAASPGAGTPKKARGGDSVRGTPTKSRVASSAATPKTTPRKKVGFAGRLGERIDQENSNSGAPAHIMPLIRKLCATFSTPPLAPHVYTGASIIIPLTDLERDIFTTSTTASKSPKPKIPQSQPTPFTISTSALTIALFFLVLAKMQRGDLDSQTHILRTEKAISISNLKGTQGEDLLTTIDIDRWLSTISEKGWARGMEWWDNIPEDVIAEDAVNLDGTAAATADSQGEQRQEDDDDDVLSTTKSLARNKSNSNSNNKRNKQTQKQKQIDALTTTTTTTTTTTATTIDPDLPDPDGVLLPGLGTMMQDRVDWLSQDRRLDYLDWRDDVMGRIGRLEGGKGVAKGKGKARAVAVA